MPNVIDQKVVQMEFDNKQFERGVAESLKSLEALKKGLELDKSAESLQNLEKIANEVDFGGLKKSIDSIGDHFTTVGRFIDRHIDKIIDGAVNKVKSALSSISIDQIGKGKAKYEQYNKAVQMIKSALPEETIENVEGTLAKLNEYTDLTSYDFATMASTIGKFTSAGIGLADAEMAMEGIANWSAAAGTEISQCNHAMYNLAQALGQGSVKLMDWKSIANANMDTKEFKELAIDMAIKLGVLGEAGEHVGVMIKGAGKKAKEEIINFQNFNSTLSDGWFTTEVLMATLKEYADRESEVGKKGFAAAKEAITFTQAIDAIKDAVSTGWMKTFILLVGNLDEATELLTTLSDNIIDFAAGIFEYRNAMLEFWHFAEFEDGVTGYTMAVESLNNVWEIFVGIADTVRDAWNKVFPPKTAEEAGSKLVELTSRIRDFTTDVKDAFDLVAQRRENGALTSLDKSSEGLFQTLRDGHSSKVVKALNDELYDLGYISKDIHDQLADAPHWEIFSYFTEDALKNLQAINGLDVTGNFDKATFDFLTKNYKEASSELIAAMDDTSVKTRDYFKVITEGAKDSDFKEYGSAVTNIQKNLVKLGYLADDKMADGVFGPKTKAALEKLQENYGIAITGAYDVDTDKIIKNALGKSNTSVWKDDIEVFQLFKEGAEGPEIQEFQEKLVELGYLADESLANGIFGPETKAALKKLQKEYPEIYKEYDDYKPEGIYDEYTEKKLNDLYEGYKKARYEVAEFNGELKDGAKGDAVKDLQKHLVQLGLLADEKMADGVFGPKTRDALKAFQLMYNLPETGIYTEKDYEQLKTVMGELREAEIENEEIESSNAKAREKRINAYADRIGNLEKMLSGISAIVHIGTGAFGLFTGAIDAVRETLSPLVDLLFFFGGLIGDCFVSLDKFITENQIFEGALLTIRILLAPLTMLFESFRDSVLKFFADHGDIKTFTDLWNVLGDAITKNPLVKFLKDVGARVSNLLGLKRIPELFSAFGTAFKNARKYASEWAPWQRTFSKQYKNLATRLWESENSIVHGIGQFMLDVYDGFTNNKAIKGIGGWIRSVLDIFGSLWTSISSVFASKDGTISISNIWNNFMSNLRNKGNSALTPLIQKLEAFKNKIVSVYNSVKDFLNNRFGTQIEQIKNFGKTITDVLSGKKKLDFPKMWEDFTKSLTNKKTGIRALIALVAGLGAGFFAVKKKTKGITGALRTFGKLKIAAIIIGIGLAIGALVLGVSKLVKWFKGGEDATSKFANTGEKLKGTFTTIGDKLKTFGSVVGAFGKAIWETLSGKGPITFSKIWENFINNLTSSGDSKLNKIATSFSNFKTRVENAITAVKNFGKNIWDWFSKTPVAKKIDEIGGKFKYTGKLLGIFGEASREVFSSGEPVTFGKIWQTFLKKLGGSNDKRLQNTAVQLKKFENRISPVVKKIKELGKTARKWISGAFSTAITWITENVPKAWTAVKSFFTGAYEWVTTSPTVQNAIKNIRGAFEKYMPGITGFISEAWGAIKDFLFPKDTNKDGGKLYANKFEEVKAHISDFVQGIKTKLKELWEAFKNSPVGKFIIKVFGPVVEWFQKKGSKLRDMISEFFTADTSTEESPIDKLKKRLEAFQPIADWFIQKKDALINGIKNLLGIEGEFSVEKALQSVQDRINGIKESIKNVDFGNILKTAGIALGAGAIFGIIKFVKNIANATSNLTDILYMRNGGKIDTIGDTMLKIASAIGIIALSLGLLATLVPPAALNNAVMAIKDMIEGLIEILGAIAVAKTMGIKNIGWQVMGMSASVALLAIGVGIMVDILTKNKGNEAVVQEAIKYVMAMVAVLGAIITALNWINPGGKKADGSIGLCIGLSVGVLILCASVWAMCALIKKYKSETVWEAVEMVSLMMSVLGAAISVINATSPNLLKAIGNVANIIAFVLAIQAMMFDVIVAIVLIEKYGDTAITAFHQIEILIGVLGGAIAAINAFGGGLLNKIGSAIEIGVMGWVLTELVTTIGDVIYKLKDIDIELMQSFFVGVDATMGIAAGIVAMFSAMGVASFVGDLGFVVFCGALAAGLKMLSGSAASAMSDIWLVGSRLGQFQEMTKDVSYERINEVVEALKNIGGFLVEYSGLITVGSTSGFRNELIYVGNALKQFDGDISSIADISKYDYAGSFDVAIKSLAGLLSSEEITGVVKDSTKVFRDEIGLFGPALKTFNDEMSGISSEEDSLSGAKQLVEDTVTFVDESNTKLSTEKTEALKTGLLSVSGALALYYQELGGVTVNETGATPEQIKSAFTGVKDALPDDGIISTIVSKTTGQGETDLTNFSLGIVHLGSALKNYNYSISTLNEEQIKKANNVLTTVAGLTTTLSGNDGNIWSFASTLIGKDNGEGTSLTDFGNSITHLGTSLKNYGDSIGKLSWYSVLAANTVIDKIASLPKTLNSSSDIWELMSTTIGKKTTLSKFSQDVGVLGSSIKNYADSCKDVTQTDIDKANGIVNSLASIELPDLTFWDWLSGKSSLGQFAVNLGDVGSGLNQFASQVKDSGIEKINMSKAMYPVRALSKVAVELQEGGVALGGFAQMFTGEASIGKLGADLATYGEKLADFVDKTKDVTYENVKEPFKVLNAIANLARRATSIGDDYNRIEGMADSLVNAIAKFGKLSDEVWVSTNIFSKGYLDKENFDNATGTIQTLSAVIQTLLNTTGNATFDFSSIENIGTNIIGAIVTGIENNSSDTKFIGVTKALTLSFASTLKALNTTYDIVFNRVGGYIIGAIVSGIEAEDTSGNNDLNPIAKAVFTLLTDTKTKVLDSQKTSFQTAGENLSKAIGNGIKAQTSYVKSYANAVAYQAWHRINDWKQSFINLGHNLDYGLAQGIREKSYHAEGAFARVVRKAYEAGKKAGGIASPSKETMWLGEMFDKGFEIGLINYSKDVSNAAGDVVGGAIDGARDGMLTLSNMIFDDIDATPVIRPVLDMSEVEAGMNGVSGMFGNQEIGIRSAILANRVAVADARNIEAAGAIASSQPDISNQLDGLNSRLDQLSSTISNMKVVTETGAVIGQIKSGMDHALGINMILAGRGAI